MKPILQRERTLHTLYAASQQELGVGKKAKQIVAGRSCSQTRANILKLHVHLKQTRARKQNDDKAIGQTQRMSLPSPKN